MGEIRRTIDVDGRRREVLLHVPDRLAPPAPLVITLHGGGGTARFAQLATGWSDKADREGFLVAYPEGTRRDASRGASFLRNPQFWNVGSGSGGYVEREKIDDSGFIGRLIDELQAEFPIDPARIYATGFSNGASLAMNLAIDLPGRLAAVAAVAGPLWRTDRAPSRPTSLIYITGDEDPLNPLEGGEVVSPWGRSHHREPLQQTIDLWSQWIGCPGPAMESEPSPGVKRRRYGPGAAGAVLEFLVVVGMGHVWPGGREVLAERLVGPMSHKLNATDAIWDFFQGAGRSVTEP